MPGHNRPKDGVAAARLCPGIHVLTLDGEKNGNASSDQVVTAMKDGVARLRKKWPQLRVTGATVTSALGSLSAAHGFPEQDTKRKALNDFIRSSGTFDGVIDFDKVALDASSGGLKPEFIPESPPAAPATSFTPIAPDIWR